jgi:hypothetical protein
MSIQNITLQRDQANAIDFLSSSITNDSKLFLFIEKNQAPVLAKRSSAAGGSPSEIAITPGTKFTANFNSADVAALSSGTYTVVDETSGTPVTIFTGTVTVEIGGNAVIDYAQYEVPSYAQKKTFTADGSMPIAIPANSIIDKVFVESASQSYPEEGVSVQVKQSAAGIPITEAATIHSGGRNTLSQGTFPSFFTGAITPYVTGGTEEIPVTIIILWKTLPV